LDSVLVIATSKRTIERCWLTCVRVTFVVAMVIASVPTTDIATLESAAGMTRCAVCAARSTWMRIARARSSAGMAEGSVGSGVVPRSQAARSAGIARTNRAQRRRVDTWGSR
jgi:hypothetical protein